MRGLAVGFIVTLLSLFFTHLQVHHLGVTVLVVLLTALVASLVAGSALWLSQTPQSALTAAVLLLVPGVPLINASIDLLRGYISAGLARAATSLMVFLGIALGLGVVLRLLEVRL